MRSTETPREMQMQVVNPKQFQDEKARTLFAMGVPRGGNKIEMGMWACTEDNQRFATKGRRMRDPFPKSEQIFPRHS